jgi:hypothetical protein
MTMQAVVVAMTGDGGGARQDTAKKEKYAAISVLAASNVSSSTDKGCGYGDLSWPVERRACDVSTDVDDAFRHSSRSD